MNSSRRIAPAHYKFASVIVLFSITLPSLNAHDFWLVSSRWVAMPGETITVTANVGENTFPVSESFTAPERVDQIGMGWPEHQVTASRFRKLGESLATDITLPQTPGTYVVTMTVKGHFLSMPPQAFTDYLREEGLNAVIAERAKLGESEVPSRERYSRQAKMLLHVGEGRNDSASKPTGLVAELVPDSDLTRKAIGDPIGVRLLYRGEPLQGAQITLTASRKTAKESKQSDKEGHATFKLKGEGPFLLSAVVMVRRTGEVGPNAADWESYWCSLTFDTQVRATLTGL
jgi:uncharacterized GH25 family protein